MFAVELVDADRQSSGGKAATLGRLLRAHVQVPDGFVVPYDARTSGHALQGSVRKAVSRQLGRLSDPVVAVRSSARDEDSAAASAAGQYESVLGVRGTQEVCAAIELCRASADTERVDAYRRRSGVNPTGAGMAVLVQPVVEAEVSGVMFTASAPDDPVRIEAAYGLGLSVAGGILAPDEFTILPDGRITARGGTKSTRIDLDHVHGGTMTSAVPVQHTRALCLDDVAVSELVRIGVRISEVLGGPQDIEWAICDGTVSILQARPITKAVPAAHLHAWIRTTNELRGVPVSAGRASGPARIVRGYSDFGEVQPGEILVCLFTDPSWTPLFSLVAGIVTETGGALSHAAIVAREYGIPAVVAVDGAMSRIAAGSRVELNGSLGRLTIL